MATPGRKQLAPAMSPKFVLVVFLLEVAVSVDTDFIYSGFHNSNLTLGGIATVTPNGLLQLTNNSKIQKGRAFYLSPLHFKNSHGAAFSFSTTFISAIVPEDPCFIGPGLAFVMSPSVELAGGMPAQFLGLFNSSNEGNSTNHILAIEHDTEFNTEYRDVDDNHVGIDINGLTSKRSAPAAYFADGRWRNFSLTSGDPVQTWIEYSGKDKILSVTISPINVPKPQRPLIAVVVDLQTVLSDPFFVGFSAATGQVKESHYILGWSYKMNGLARPLNHSSLPLLPQVTPKKKSKVLTIAVPILGVFIAVTSLAAGAGIVRRKIKYAEELEDWEREYGPHRFRYKDLFVATKGFRDQELLGLGGFGQVYRGVLPSSKIEVAVKKIAHNSKQGMKEFVTEIVSLGGLRHRNLVQLLGYCRRKGELLLVYEYMPNGSLDKFLFDHKSTLSWNQRFQIVKGVASGLLYLHEEWEQVVIHRDIKASNVLLDSELNGRLGDFGLARLYDHGTAPSTTHIVGTIGYLAPELVWTGKASTSTDIFAFGAFVLEVATGRRPIHVGNSPDEELVLADWVFGLWRRGSILEASDPKLGGDYAVAEMELMLKIGLLCSHPEPAARPSMREVVRLLEGDEVGLLKEMEEWNVTERRQAYESIVSMYTSSSDFGFGNTSFAESLLSQGR